MFFYTLYLHFCYLNFSDASSNFGANYESELEAQYKRVINAINEYKKYRNTCYTKIIGFNNKKCSITFKLNDLENLDSFFEDSQQGTEYKQSTINGNTIFSENTKQNNEKLNIGAKGLYLSAEDAYFYGFMQRDSSNINESKKFATRETINLDFEPECEEDLQNIISKNLFGFKHKLEFSKITFYDEEIICEKFTESFDEEKCRGKIVYCFKSYPLVRERDQKNSCNKPEQNTEDENTIEINLFKSATNVKTLLFFSSEHSEVEKIANNNIDEKNLETARIFISFSIILQDFYDFNNVLQVCHSFSIYKIYSEIIETFSEKRRFFFINLGVFLINEYDFKNEEKFSNIKLLLTLKGLDLLFYIRLIETGRNPSMVPDGRRLNCIDFRYKFINLKNNEKFHNYRKDDIFTFKDRLFSMKKQNNLNIDHGKEYFQFINLYNYANKEKVRVNFPGLEVYFESDVLNILARVSLKEDIYFVHEFGFQQHSHRPYLLSRKRKRYLISWQFNR